ncbi:MAG: hypothetical protein ACYS0D_07740 [Planctomycetota bacterium]|jgi:hypothetical protein
MRIFLALLIDAYHELNSKKLFWIVLVISGLVVLVYGSFGFHETGMSMFYGLRTIESEFLTKGSLISEILYRSIFTWFIVGIWLAWAATILALVATTTIFPDFLAGGAVDLVLSKPIRRVTLFFYKYLVSLLFMVLQVGLFCIGVFLCLGLRLGDWDWKIFLAIPILTVFYSYLYSVNVFVGVWTRSALAALLLTMLFWFSLFGVAAAESIIYQQRTRFVIDAERNQESIERLETRLEELGGETPEEEPTGEAALQRSRVLDQLEETRSDLEEQNDLVDRLDRWHRPVRVMVWCLPKTSETVNLLDRYLRRDTDVNIMDIFTGSVVPDEDGGFSTRDTSTDRELQRRLTEELYSRSLWYVLGTSLLFEVVVLAGACTVFVRRDF